MKKYIILLLFAISIFSCEKELNVDMPDGDIHIVVNGIINPDSLIKIRISESKNILDTSRVNYLENAQVHLYENDVFIEDMSYMPEQFYVSSANPIIGRTYRINVDYTGLESIQSENSVPRQVNIIAGEATYGLTEIMTGDTIENRYKINYRIEINDAGNTNNFYFVGVPRFREYQVEIDGVLTYFYDEYNEIESKDPVLSSNFNDFNILGLSGKVFNDEYFNGNTQIIIFSVLTSYIEEPSALNNEFPFCIVSITEDLYKYVISVNKNKESGDNPFSEPVQIHSNIENGKGIFSGFTPTYDTLTVTRLKIF